MDSSVEVSIEKLDDVAFEKEGQPFDLLQTKHHLNKAASLSDGSVDLWKTLRVWAELTRQDPSLPGRTRFALVTTGPAPDGSAAQLLRPAMVDSPPRDISLAHEMLMAAAEASTNKELKKAIEVFTGLPPAQRESLLSAVQVLDGYPLISDLEAVIEKQIVMIAPSGKVGLARQQLEGWWWPRVCAILQSAKPGVIAVTEVEQKLDDIRDSLKRDALPLDMEGVEPPATELDALNEMPFVRQLREVGIGKTRLEYAKRDYYRAFTQRSQWIRQSLLFDGEMSRFEGVLIEEWQPRFAQMCDGLPSNCDDSEIRNAGLSLYAWVEVEARFPFRSIINRFLNVGSFHMLANDLRVGWHRDYETMFSKQTEGA
ncbi:ABC-three component system protein [Mesorhizobium sp.]|uniref:ABC-three component system protein n=1 Tax=Mesorhizobium sp. TaxID=1871066 RepID=UPI0025CEE633|nr:ABC-three component system protein [Mesorhizobium sp.]